MLLVVLGCPVCKYKAVSQSDIDHISSHNRETIPKAVRVSRYTDCAAKLIVTLVIDLQNHHKVKFRSPIGNRVGLTHKPHLISRAIHVLMYATIIFTW